MMNPPLAFFAATPDPQVFEPLSMVISRWDPTQLKGPSITGLLTRGALDKVTDLGLDVVLVKVTYELHTVARLVSTEIRARVVKQGRRVVLIDVELFQEDREVARAHAYFAAPMSRAEGALWERKISITPPSREATPDTRRQLYYSDDSGWTNKAGSLQGSAQKAIWIAGGELVQGEQMCGSLLAGYAADITNAVVNWGTAGIAHINMDSTMSLTREPLSDGIGIFCTFASEENGISAGSAMLFDREGPLGVTTVSAIAHGRVVDPSSW